MHLKEFIIGFIIGVGQGMLILDWLHSKQDLNAIIEAEKGKK